MKIYNTMQKLSEQHTTLCDYIHTIEHNGKGGKTMKTQSNLTILVHADRHPPLPIRYWMCKDVNGYTVDTNNSIRILRHKWDWNKSLTYHAIR